MEFIYLFASPFGQQNVNQNYYTNLLYICNCLYLLAVCDYLINYNKKPYKDKTLSLFAIAAVVNSYVTVRREHSGQVVSLNCGYIKYNSHRVQHTGEPV